jgi:hypothetical protein
MAGILLPNSETIFNVTRHAPESDMEWTNVQTSAVVLAEVGICSCFPVERRRLAG